MAQFAVSEAVVPAMSGSELTGPLGRVISEQLDHVHFAPHRGGFCAQIQNPAIHLIQPMGTGLLLHVGNHGGEGMSGAVVAGLEPLNASGRPGGGDDVFAFVPVRALRRRESFALDREQRVELAVSPPLNDQRSPEWFCDKVNLSAAERLVAGLGSKLHMTPDGRGVCGVVEVIAKELGQGGLNGGIWTVGVIAPAGKLVSDESDEFQFRGRRQVNVPADSAQLHCF